MNDNVVMVMGKFGGVLVALSVHFVIVDDGKHNHECRQSSPGYLYGNGLILGRSESNLTLE